MARIHPAAEVLSRAARDLRRVLQEHDGNVLNPGDEESIADAASAVGFTLSDFCREASTHSSGSRYNAELVPQSLNGVGEAAKRLGLVAGGYCPPPVT